MINKLTIQLINLYQRYVSPHKGFCCAYRVHTGGLSCSQYTKEVIQENGLFKALPLVKKQFSKCKIAYQEIQEKKSKDNDKEKISSFCEGCACDCLGTSACLAFS